MKTTFAKLGAVIYLLLGSLAANAQDYPTHTIKIIVPLPPAGAPDLVARIVGQRLSERVGQPVVIENRTGANGSIGGEAVARANPDGYTLLLPQDSLIVVNPHVYSKMSFNPLSELAPITMVASNLFYLTVTPSLPAKTFEEFVALAKKSDPPLLYGSPGNGSQHHLAMEMLKQRAGINLRHIPYRGAGPAVTAAIRGEVAAIFGGGVTSPLIRSNKLRALAVTGKERSREFPALPTIGSFYPGYEITTWFGLFAPTGTPDHIITKLRKEITAIIKEPEVTRKFASSGGMQPFLLAPADFASLIRSEYDKFGAIVSAIKLQSN